MKSEFKSRKMCSDSTNPNFTMANQNFATMGNFYTAAAAAAAANSHRYSSANTSTPTYRWNSHDPNSYANTFPNATSLNHPRWNYGTIYNHSVINAAAVAVASVNTSYNETHLNGVSGSGNTNSNSSNEQRQSAHPQHSHHPYQHQSAQQLQQQQQKSFSQQSTGMIYHVVVY